MYISIKKWNGLTSALPVFFVAFVLCMLINNIAKAQQLNIKNDALLKFW